jgi:thiol-disulfide isomerase/thioredoxin
MKSSSTSLPAPLTERRRLLAGLAGLAAWPLLGFAQGRGMTAVAGTPPAPPLRLPDSDGKPVDLAAYRGKVVLVNFWATWCPPCRQELPSLSRLKKKLSGEAFEILSVNIGEDVDTVFDFAGNPNYPMLFDHDSTAMASWPVKGVPTTLLVDRQGRLAYRAVGGREFDDAEVVALIRQLLKA